MRSGRRCFSDAGQKLIRFGGSYDKIEVCDIYKPKLVMREVNLFMLSAGEDRPR